MYIGYARVSTDDQNLDLQYAAFEKAGIPRENIYSEYRSGATTKRPELENCFKALRGGDTLVVWRLDRLGRSVRDLLKLTDELKDRQIQFKSLNESIDTNTPMGFLFFIIVAAFAQFERDVISERTKAGLAAAKKKGHVGGRPSSITPEKLAAVEALRSGDNPLSMNEAAKVVGVSGSAVYRRLKQLREEAEGARDEAA